jgi:hypothetical protein
LRRDIGAIDPGGPPPRPEPAVGEAQTAEK